MVAKVGPIEKFRIDEIRSSLIRNVSRKLEHCPSQCLLELDVEIRDGRNSWVRCTTTRTSRAVTQAFPGDTARAILRTIDEAIRPELEQLAADFHGAISIGVEIDNNVCEIKHVVHKVTWQSR